MVQTDTQLLDWYEANSHLVVQIGNTWYSRGRYGYPLHKGKGLRDAIIRAQKLQARYASKS